MAIAVLVTAAVPGCYCPAEAGRQGGQGFGRRSVNRFPALLYVLCCHPALTAAPQEEGAKAGKAREQMAAKLQQLERQRGEVERTRDELKVGVRGGSRLALSAGLAGLQAGRLERHRGEVERTRDELKVGGAVDGRRWGLRRLRG